MSVCLSGFLKKRSANRLLLPLLPKHLKYFHTICCIQIQKEQKKKNRIKRKEIYVVKKVLRRVEKKTNKTPTTRKKTNDLLWENTHDS